MSGNTGDDKTRIAAHMSATLSQSVMAAVLAMLTITGASYVFIVRTFNLDGLVIFTTLVSVVMGLLVLSIVLGGKGVSTTYRKIAEGAWKPEDSKNWYNGQAILALLGVAMLAGVVVSYAFLTQPEPKKTLAKETELIEDVQKNIKDLRDLKEILSQVQFR